MGCCGWDRGEAEPDALRAPQAGMSLVELRRAQAAVELQTVTGGGSLCRVEGSPQVKRSEGALASLSELHRLLGRENRLDPAAGTAQVLATWREHRVTAERLGPTWQDYRDGGIFALESLQEDLG